MTETFEIARTGVVVAFDADTGEPLIVNEIYEEVIEGKADYSQVPTDEDCEVIEAEAQRSYASKKIDIIAAPNSDLSMSEDVPVEWQVDLESRKLVQKERPDGFATRTK